MRYVPKRGAVNKIVQSSGVKNAIFNEASTISSRAGAGVEPRESQLRGKRSRPRAVALTTTAEAINRNRKRNTLVRSIR